MARIGVTSSVSSGTTGARVLVSSFATGVPDFDPADFDPGDFSTLSTSPHVLLTSTATAGLLGQIMPSRHGNGYVRVGWYISIDGAPYIPLQGTISAPRSLERNIQTASFSALASGSSRLGPALHGTPTGRKPITVGMYFRDDEANVTLAPILTDGACLDNERSMGALPVDSLAVQDKNAILSLVKATHQVPAGSNRLRSQIISALAVAAGATTAEISLPADMGRALKAIDLDKGSAVDLGQAIAEIPGYRLVRGRDGTFTAVPYRPELPFSRIDWVYGPGDWIESIGGQETAYRLRASPVPYHRIELRGSKQVTRGDADDACGDDTLELQNEAFTLNFDPNALPNHQGAGAGPGPPSVTPTGVGAFGGDPEQRVSLSLYQRTERCGAVVSERTKSWRYRNLEAARQLMSNDPDPVVDSFYSVFLDDGGNAWVYGADRWMQDTIEDVGYTYNSDNFLTQKVTNRYGWYNPKVALKERPDVATAWDTVGSVDSLTYRVLGNGHGVTFNLPVFGLIETIVEDFGVENGYVTTSSSSRSGWGRIPGGLYLYRDGEFGQPAETFQELESESTRYVVLKKDPPLTKVFIETRSIEAQNANEISSTSETRSQAPPQAQRGPIHAEDGAELTADRLEHQEMSATCTIAGLSLDRFTQELATTLSEYAETPEELRAMCRRLGLFGASGRLSFVAPPNPHVDLGHVLRFRGRPGEGIDEVGIVIENTPLDFGGVPFSEIVIEVYPDIVVNFS